MLTRDKTIEETQPDGTTFVRTVGVEDEPCANCGSESLPQTCALDTKYHWHGRVHVAGGGLVALCNRCHALYTADPHKFTVGEHNNG